MKRFLKYVIPTVAAVFCFVSLNAQQRVHIAGLEDNAEYRRLLAEEREVARMSDSISDGMNRIRQNFRTDTQNRAANTAALLRMEEEIFELRDRSGKLAGQINAIEQEWILRSLNDDEQEPDATAGHAHEAEERRTANLVYNTFFDGNLRPDDLRDLRRAQDMEREIPALVEQYRTNNRQLAELKRSYDAAAIAETAEGIKAVFDSIARINRGIEREIASTWGTIFDNKSYCYNFVMDKNNRTGILQDFENDMEKLRLEQAELQGVYASDAITEYILQKRLLTRYELLIAEELSNRQAADSLKKVQAALPRTDKLGIEPVKFRERLFLDYNEIAVNASSPYNSRNPIPQVEVYPKGVIYRVLLGTFSGPQQPSAFRNVSPLAVQKGPDGKYRYFAGGFPSDSTANAAVDQMQKRGFRKPEAVVWMDGVYVNLATGKGFGSGFYRVELSGVDELTPEVREVIRTVTGGRDIVRAGGMFIVGPIDDASEAARFRTALEGRDPDMEIKIMEIPD